MQTALEALGGVETPSIKDFWKWVCETFTPAYRLEIEDNLSQAVDMTDLEYRMKVLKLRGLL